MKETKGLAMTKYFLAAALGLLLALTATAGAGDIPIPRERQLIEDQVCCRTQLFDEDGKHIGVSIERGNTTWLYFDDGTTGSVRFKGNMAIYYNGRGKKISQEKTR
jgi:hypothetical protein